MTRCFIDVTFSLVIHSYIRRRETARGNTISLKSLENSSLDILFCTGSLKDAFCISYKYREGGIYVIYRPRGRSVRGLYIGYKSRLSRYLTYLIYF